MIIKVKTLVFCENFVSMDTVQVMKLTHIIIMLCCLKLVNLISVIPAILGSNNIFTYLVSVDSHSLSQGWGGGHLPLGAWDRLRCLIVALREPSIYNYCELSSKCILFHMAR